MEVFGTIDKTFYYDLGYFYQLYTYKDEHKNKVLRTLSILFFDVCIQTKNINNWW